MNKYRYFGLFMNAQENWLNRNAQKGYRLKDVSLLRYTFEHSVKGAYQYAVEWVGHLSREEQEDYIAYLKDCGYQVWTKNANLNYALGKIKFRPWAHAGARWAHQGNTYQRELLIVEKKSDGLPFQLHTEGQDQIRSIKNIRRVFAFWILMLAVAALITRHLLIIIFAVVFFIPYLYYTRSLYHIRHESLVTESPSVFRKKSSPFFTSSFPFLFTGILLLCLFGAYRAGFFTLRSGTFLFMQASSSSSSYQARYKFFSGKLHKKLSPPPGQKHFQIKVQTIAGTMHVTVSNEKETQTFVFKDKGTATKAFPLEGPVTLTLEGDSHNGSVEAKWIP